MSEIYIAGGCFWGMEQYMRAIHGVLHTEVGYANGTLENPTYEEVCRGNTGHAETVRVEYDAAVLPLSFLLTLYFEAINPTVKDRQGADEGPQYRTGIYYVEEADRPVIESALQALQARYEKPIVVECERLSSFYPAEEYHQGYLAARPGGYCHIPKEKIRHAAEASRAGKG